VRVARSVRTALVGVLVLAGVSIPSPASAASSEMSVSVAAFEDVTGPGLGDPIEGRPTLEIHTAVRLVYHVEQTGESRPYVFRLLLAGDRSYYTNPGLIPWTALPNGCGYAVDSTDPEASAVVECLGGSFDLVAKVVANAPGTIAVVGEVDTTGFGDTDPTDDAATWLADSVCSVYGTEGDDLLEGTDDAETVCGGAGDDDFVNLGEYDWVFGQDGRDSFSGGFGGGSRAIGGEGIDTASFAEADRPITICILEPGVATNVNIWAPQAMIQIERFVGSPYGDKMSGTAGPDVMLGLAGADVLLARAGEDRLRGGRGEDRFVTRDASVDVILGGRGSDAARADGDDRIRSARRSSDAIDDPCA
jgi:Ca2+-binding RTX toxin-like protein